MKLTKAHFFFYQKHSDYTFARDEIDSTLYLTVRYILGRLATLDTRTEI